jgi:hypothetical protein
MTWEWLSQVHANLGWVWEGEGGTRWPVLPKLVIAGIENPNPLANLFPELLLDNAWPDLRV